MSSLQVEASGLAGELAKDLRKRLQGASAQVQTELLPRIEEVSTLLAQVAVLRIGAASSEPTELEKVLRVRLKLLTSAVELRALDAIQDTVETTVARVITAGFALLVRA